jgi:hypothetical protein
MRTDGHDEAIVAFRNYANEPKNELRSLDQTRHFLLLQLLPTWI